MFVKIKKYLVKFLRKYSENFIYLFLFNIIKILAGIFVGALVARYLGPEQFGTLQFANSIIIIFGTLSGFGVAGVLGRELVLKNKSKEDLMGTGITLLSIGAFIAYSLLLFLSFSSISEELTQIRSIILVLGVTFFIQIFQVHKIFFESIQKNKYIAISQIISLITVSFIRIYLVLNNYPLIYFVITLLVSEFVFLFVLQFFSIRQQFTIFKFKFSKQVTFSILKDCWPSIFAGVIFVMQSNIDQIMLTEMVGASDCAQYNVAYRFISMLAFIPTIIVQVFWPSMIRKKQNSEDGYYNDLEKFYRLMTLSLFFVILPFILFGNLFIDLLYGEQYAEAAVLMKYFTLRLIFIGLIVIVGKHHILLNVLRRSLVCSILMLVTNIVLNYFLIKKYQVFGANLSTVITYFIFLFWDVLFQNTRRGLKHMLKGIFNPFGGIIIKIK